FQGGNVAPEGRTDVRLRIQAGPGGADVGHRFIVSRPIVEQGEAVGEFFTGADADTDTKAYEWIGTPDESASKETTTTIDAGIPGDGPGWSLLWAATGGGGTPAPPSIGQWEVTRETSTGTVIPSRMDRTR